MTLQSYNALLNLIANLVLFSGGMIFYYNHISKSMGFKLYHFMRLFTAMLLTGSLSRCIYDCNNLITGYQSDNFIWWEAAIALLRNFGLGAILMYLLLKKK